MTRALYHASRISGTAIGPAADTALLTARLSAAVTALSRLPEADASRVAGKIGAMIGGEGRDGAFFAARGFDGQPAVFWTAGMDEALKALAIGDTPRGEALLDQLLAVDRRNVPPAQRAMLRLEDLAKVSADMAMLAGSLTGGAKPYNAPVTGSAS